ncbi:AraC family transcriptional regulator [Pseudoalteromonas sp. Of7M-16]|uniref:helix-turn-helix domain-containing protein n=1 Tax=Pseudoalteromonas sp. Of7M-16 TaxID=2917756 RepID=UPI001EF4F498|nr:AraC family transcriptional regulator [Pseudoalteromonas sp. Of7M-16]MCG7546771.1 AraC family transcriptional regulator [Pseudoalteromonas sp. Of7M-16]
MTSTGKQVFQGAQYQGETVMGIKQFSAPYTYQDGLVNEARLIHIFKGQSSLICAGKTLSLKAGDTLLMKADNFINRWLDNGHCGDVEFVGVRLTQLHIQKLYQNNPLETFAFVGAKPEAFDVVPRVLVSQSTLLKSYFTTLKHYIECSSMMTDSLIGLKIQELLELFACIETSGEIPALLAELFVPNQPMLQEVVQTHLFSPLKVEELAFLCHMSASTFNRKFKQVYGMSANKYLVAKRLERASLLIKTTDRSVTDVALECGFEELSYFSRVFKQHFQLTPSQLRKSTG